MEENYFENKFKKILESPPEYLPGEAEVSDMKSRLRAAKPSNKKRAGWLMLVPFILIPFLLSASYFYGKYSSLKDEIIELKNQFSQIKKTNDTIIEKQIIHHFDTIHTVVYRVKYIENKSTNAQSQKLYNNLLNQRTAYFNTSKTTIGRGLAKPKSSLLDIRPGSIFLTQDLSGKKNTTTTTPENLKHLDIISLNKLQSIRPAEIDLDERLNEYYPELKERKINPLFYALPTGFKAKANAAPFLFLQNAYGGKGRTYGMNGEIELPKNRSLQLGIEYMEMSLKFNDRDNLPDIPIALPDDPSDNLKEAKAKMYCIQIPLGIRHKLLNKSIIHPTVSAGIVAAIPLRQTFTYEYINATDEYHQDISTKNGSISFDNLRLGLGAEYSLFKNFSLESEVQYQHGFSQNETALFPVRYWSMQFGLNYKL